MIKADFVVSVSYYVDEYENDTMYNTIDVYMDNLFEGSKAVILLNAGSPYRQSFDGTIMEIIDSSSMYDDDYEMESDRMIKSYNVFCEKFMDDDYIGIGIDIN